MSDECNEVMLVSMEKVDKDIYFKYKWSIYYDVWMSWIWNKLRYRSSIYKNTLI